MIQEYVIKNIMIKIQTGITTTNCRFYYIRNLLDFTVCTTKVFSTYTCLQYNEVTRSNDFQQCLLNQNKMKINEFLQNCAFANLIVVIIHFNLIQCPKFIR